MGGEMNPINVICWTCGRDVLIEPEECIIKIGALIFDFSNPFWALAIADNHLKYVGNPFIGFQSKLKSHSP